MVGFLQGFSAGTDITAIGSLLNSIFPNQQINNPYSFDRFAAVINQQQGITPSNRFVMFITPPPILLQAYNNITGNILPFLCHSCNLPGIEISSVDYYNQGYGAVQHSPTRVRYERLITNFYADNGGAVINFFDTWLNKIVNNKTPTGSASAGVGGFLTTTFNSNINNADAYETYFHDDYVTTAQIHVYDRTNSPIVSYEFDEMWPFLRNDSRLAWQQHNSNLIIPIGFHYKTYKIIQYTNNGTPYSNGSLGSAVQQLGQIVQEFTTLGQSPLSITSLSTAITSGFGLL
jgi:hypothetical protein